MKLKQMHLLEFEYENKLSYGFNQKWHKGFFKRLSGCGPTTGTMLLYYLKNRDDLNLKISTNSFDELQDSLDYTYNIMKPTVKGIDSTTLYVNGLNKILTDSDLSYNIHNIYLRKDEQNELHCYADFIKEGIKKDSPVAFLNLHSGKVLILESWHWLTIVSIIDYEDDYFITCYDNGNKIEFKLGDWFNTTKLGGGFVYIE